MPDARQRLWLDLLPMPRKACDERRPGIRRTGNGQSQRRPAALLLAVWSKLWQPPHRETLA
jgi:hypothetical protein